MIVNTKRVWVFDLDDTLHDASSHIFPVMNQAMTQYIMDHLHLNQEDAHALRKHYWRIYGATLKGLVRHHEVDPHHFLETTHAFLDTKSMVIQTKGLRKLIKRLSGRKQVFTNAPLKYALSVLKFMGIQGMFETIFSVESTKFHPKPSVRGFKMMLNTIGAKASDCIMVEDNAEALKTAKRLGMKTILVSKRLHKPSYVDARIPNILKLGRTHI